MSTISAGTTSTTTLIHSGDTTGSLVLKTNDTGSGGTTAVTIDTSQNVGIGTSSPSARVDNTGTFRSTGATDPSSGTGLELSYRSTYGDVLAYNRTSSSFVQLQIRGEPIIFGNSGGERMRIDSSGNVGIGTSSPTNAISVSRSTGEAVISITNAGSASSWLTLAPSSSGNAYIHNTSNAATVFTTNGSERMRIDSSGNLLVGVQSQFNSCKQALVFDGSTNIGLAIKNSNVTVGQVFIGFYNSAGTNIGTITQNATTTVAYNTSSDYRLKENIVPMTGALSKVALLKPVTYTWKQEFGGESGQGFIAHELQDVVPDCVTGEKDAVDANGNPVYQGIDTSFLVATLTAAIQEQQALIQQLQADVAALKGV